MKRNLRVILGLVAVLLLIVLIPGTGSANVVYQCEDNEFCDYKHITFNIGDPDNRCRTFDANDADYSNNVWWNCTTGTAITSDGLNDDTTSIQNQWNSSNAAWYRNANYGCPCTTLGPNIGDVNLSDNNVGNDQASSHRLV